MNNTIETQDEETGDTRFTNSRFTCLGISRREPFGEIWTPEDPDVYQDVLEFIKDVEEQVIPSNLYL